MAELKNEFSWSKSREDCFHRCPRQYFFTYYGSWGGWDKRAPERTRAIYIYKQLQSRQQWIGATVHNCLRWVLATLRKKGAAPEEETALGNMAKRLQVDFQDSGEGLYWENPKDHCALLEHEYEDLEVSDEEWQQLTEKALHCVSAFYQSDVLKNLSALPGDHWLELEDLASFDVNGIKAWVQLDCAHRDGAGARIYDWKTGKADTAATREQLALYTLYAASRWKLAPEAIAAMEFNLATGETFEHHAAPADLDAARARVAESAAAMKALLDDPAGNVAREESFAMTDNERTCRHCNYRRVCPKFAASPNG